MNTPFSTARLHESLPTLPGTAARVRAIIDTKAVTDNYSTLLGRVRAISPTTEGIAVVKADAYGHGIRPVVGALLTVGCRAFAVACLEEAMALRILLRELLADENADTPLILILGYTNPTAVKCLSDYCITATILSDAHAAALAQEAEQNGVTVAVHVALDTGMNRIGYPAHTDTEISATVDRLVARFGTSTHVPGLQLDGLFTHFARADEDYDTEMTETDSLTALQYARYRAVLNGLQKRGLRPRLCHVCNSAAAVRFPEAHPEGCLDAVRLGINLYGYGVKPHSDNQTTRPVMRLMTHVTHVHELLPGETVGYGGTYTATEPRVLVTLPIGYADGWIRALTGASVTLHTSVGDCKAPIVGRICMDQCMVDITDLPPIARETVCPDTEITLFGQTSAELEALATRAHTITYELLCLITARVTREYPPL